MLWRVKQGLYTFWLILINLKLFFIFFSKLLIRIFDWNGTLRMLNSFSYISSGTSKYVQLLNSSSSCNFLHSLSKAWINNSILIFREVLEIIDKISLLISEHFSHSSLIKERDLYLNPSSLLVDFFVLDFSTRFFTFPFHFIQSTLNY